MGPSGPASAVDARSDARPDDETARSLTQLSIYCLPEVVMKAIPIFPLAALMLAAACGGDSGSPTGPLSLGPRNFIEALFLSDGPLSVGPPSDFMAGFPVGSQITVTFLNTVNEDQRSGVRDITASCGMITVARDPGALLGAIPCSMGLTFTYSETSDRERMEDALLQGGPKPPKNEVWVYQTDGACPVRGEGEHAVLGQPGGVTVSPRITTRLGLV